MRGLYLFTNRLGQRAMSIRAKGLAAKLRTGEIQLLGNVLLMDRRSTRCSASCRTRPEIMPPQQPSPAA